MRSAAQPAVTGYPINYPKTQRHSDKQPSLIPAQKHNESTVQAQAEEGPDCCSLGKKATEANEK